MLTIIRLVERFLEDVSGLGHKLGVLLAQLPPSLAYDAEVAADFFTSFAHIEATLATEPRHASWFTPHADAALRDFRVVRVAADPPRGPGDGVPGGDLGGFPLVVLRSVGVVTGGGAGIGAA